MADTMKILARLDAINDSLAKLTDIHEAQLENNRLLILIMLALSEPDATVTPIPAHQEQS